MSFSAENWTALTLFTVLAILTIIPNLVFILLIAKVRKLWSRTNWILFSLSVSDLLVGAIITPLDIVNIVPVFNMDSYIYCVLINSLVTCVPFVSAFHLLSVTIERYINIMFPLNYIRIVTKRKVIFMIVSSWIIPILFSSFPLMGWRMTDEEIHFTYLHKAKPGQNETDFYCLIQRVFASSYLQFVMYLLIVTSIIIFGLYIIIFNVARHHAKKIARESLASSQRARRLRFIWSQIRTSAVLAVTVGCFWVCVLPLCFTLLLYCYGHHVTQELRVTVSLMFFMNSMINPYVYGLGSRDIRRALLRKMHGFCCGGEHLDYTRSHSLSNSNLDSISVMKKHSCPNIGENNV